MEARGCLAHMMLCRPYAGNHAACAVPRYSEHLFSPGKTSVKAGTFHGVPKFRKNTRICRSLSHRYKQKWL